MIETAAFGEPLLPPSKYGQYERVLEGRAERILAMAEKQQQHRTVWENKHLEVAASEATRGPWLESVVVIICIGSAVYLASRSHQFVSGTGGVG